MKYFVHNINVDGLSSQQAQNTISIFINNLNNGDERHFVFPVCNQPTLSTFLYDSNNPIQNINDNRIEPLLRYVEYIVENTNSNINRIRELEENINRVPQPFQPNRLGNIEFV